MPVTLNTRQNTVLAAKKTNVSWLFTVTDASDNRYYWSTKTYSYSTPLVWDTGVEWPPYAHWANEEGRDFEARIIDFDGITLERARIEDGVIGAPELTFGVSNPGNTLTPGDFEGGTVWLALSCADASGDEVMRRWRFRIKKTEQGYQQFRCTCENWIAPYLRGEYPNTRLVRDIFPGTEEDLGTPDVCVPVVFGTGYVPLASVYVSGFYSYTASTISAVAAASGARCKLQDSADGLGIFEAGRFVTVTGFTESANNVSEVRALVVAAGEIELPEDAGLVTEAAGDSVTITQGSRAYLLGDAADTYTVTKVHSPRDLGPSTEWASTTYTMTQTSKDDAASNSWKLLHPIIFDLDKDGTPDAPGVFGPPGGPYPPVPAKFSITDSNTPALANMTCPADILHYVFRNFGVSALYLDMVSHATAKTTYSGWGLTWNGGLWYKHPRKKLLSMLLTMCHTAIIVDEAIELKVRSKTSQATLTDADILAGTFRYSDTREERMADSGWIAWQTSDRPQDRFFKNLVPVKSTRTTPGADILDLPWVQDSQDVQALGTLHYQRKLTKEADIAFEANDTHIDLNPDDVITINDTVYGGNYPLLIDSVTIHKDLRVGLECHKLSETLDDFGDLSPDAVTIPTDDTRDTYAPPIAGPLSAESIGTQGYDVWGNPYLVVGPNTNHGKYTDIQQAVNALTESSHNGIFLLNGSYTLSDALYLIDRDIEILGESEGGVIVKNNAGDHGFILHNLTKKFSIAKITFDSQNNGSYAYMVYVYGDTAADNTSDVTIDKTTFLLTDGGDGTAVGDVGIYADKGEGSLTILNAKINDGIKAVYSNSYEKIHCFGGVCDDQKTDTIEFASPTNGIIEGVKILNFHLNGIHVTTANIVKIKTNILRSHDDARVGTPTSRGIYVGNLGSGESSLVSGNNVKVINTRASGWHIALQLASAPGGMIKDNIVYIDISSDQNTWGIASDSDDCQVSNNNVVLDNDDVTGTHYGIVQSGDRGVVQGNNVNCVNNDAKDIGISVSGDNNQGGDNITYNVGTSVSDTGAGNAVTAKDV